MAISFKKVLLTGTALVAVSFIPAQAEANPRTMSTSQTWASSGAPNCTLTTVSTACTGEAVTMTSTPTLTVTNDGMASDDGVSFDTFILGAVTNTTGKANVLVTNGAPGEGNTLDVTIDSVDINGAFSVIHNDNSTFSTYDTLVSITSNLTADDTLKVINNEGVTGATQVTSLTVGGNLTTGTTTTITGGGAAGATALVNVAGNSTFKGTATVNAGSGAGSDATLTLSGATNTFTGGLVLNDNGGSASVVFDGGGAQTVSGTISGNTGGEGTVLVNNSSGVTFSGALGITKLDSVVVTNGASDSAATFKANVSANTIVLGDASSSGTNTVTFDATTAGFTVTGALDGTTSSATNNIVIAGGTAKTVTTSGTWGAGGFLNDVTLQNANLTTGASSELTANTINIGAGTTLTAGSDVTTLTPNGLLFNGAGGTVTLLSGVDLFSDVDTSGSGIGTLNLNAGVQTVFGDVGGNGFALSTVKAGQTGATSTFTGVVNALTINAGSGDIDFQDDVTGDFKGAVVNAGIGTINFGGDLDGKVNFGVFDGEVILADGMSITDNFVNGVGTVDATAANKGTLTLDGANTVTGAIGGTQAIKVLNTGAGADSGASFLLSTVKAQTINMMGTQTVNFGGATTATDIKFFNTGTAAFADNVTGAINFLGNNGFVTIADGKTITGTVNTNSANTGTLTLDGANTVTGAVGLTSALLLVQAGAGSGNSSFLSTVNAQSIGITGTNTVSFAGNVTGAIDFGTNDGTVTIASGKNLTGVGGVAAEGGGATAGTLTFLGGTQVVNGTIGATDALTALNAGAALGTTTFNDTVNADTINVGTGTANFTDVVTAIDITLGTGTVKFNDATGNLDLGGNNGTVTLVTGDFTGDIDNATGGVTSGTLNLSAAAGTQQVTGLVGATKALTTINAGAGTAVSTFLSAVSAGTLKVGTGDVNLNGLTGAVDFGGNGGMVTLASGTGVSGSIDNSTGTGGTLVLAGGTQTIGYAVGSLGALSLIQAGAAGATATFSSAITATTLEVIGTGDVFLNGLTGGIDFAGNDGVVTLASNTGVTGLVDNTGVQAGTLVLGGGSQTITGAVGGVNGLNQIDAGTALLDVSFFTGGTVRADTFNLGAGTTKFADAVIADTINTTAGAVEFADTVNAATVINLDTGTYTFADVVTAPSIKLDAGTADFNDNITGTLSFIGDGLATIAAGSTVTGAIDNATISPTGTLTFEGSATVTGAIGASKALNVINFDGIGQTIATGAFRAGMTTNLGDNTVASSGLVSIAAGQTINAAATGVSGLVLSGGGITSATGATIGASTKVDVDLSGVTGYIADGAVFTLVDSLAGGAVSTLGVGNITDNSFFFSFDQGASTTDLDLVIDRPALASFADTKNNKAVGDVLDIINGSATGTLMSVQIALQSAASAGEINKILEGLVPSPAGEAVVAALNDISAAHTAVEIRMAELRTGDGMTGMTAGSSDGMISGENVWFQAYGQTATQDAHDGVKGYDSDTIGFAMGVDSTNVYNNGVFGLSLNFGQTSAESDNATTTNTDVDSYGVNLYTSYDLGEDAFFNGQFGYGYNKINSDRHNVVAPGDVANADYSSHQLSGKVAVGTDYPVDYSTLLTPSISADYTHLRTGSYTETGIGAAGLDVSSETFNALKLGVGVNTAWNLINSDGSMLKPALRVGYTYNLINDKIETTASFIGDPAGTTFATVGPDPDRSAFNLGGGLTYMTNFNWDLSGNYDYTYKTNYTSHAGVMRATARF